MYDNPKMQGLPFRNARTGLACASLAGTLLGMALMVPGCMLAGSPGSSSLGSASTSSNRIDAPDSNSGQQITMAELDGLTKAYADRYMTLIVAACDDISRANPSLEQRRMANLFKTASVTAIYDVATNPDPFTQLIDMLLVVTLQSMVWIDEDNATKLFPGRDEFLVLAIRRAREDIWELARRVMTPKQLDDLDRLMVEWRRQNQDIQFVSFVRFGDFADRRGKSIISEVRSGGGFLAPAKQAIDETRLLAERIFYITKRAPFILSWQAQTIADDLLIKPEVSGALSQLDQIASAADRAASAAESIPALVTSERQALIAEIDAHEKQLSEALAGYRAAVGDTRSLVTELNATMSGATEALAGADQVAKSLDQTIGTLDAFMSAHTAPAGSEPFEIEPFAAAIRDLTLAVKELNALMVSTESLIGSESLNARLDQLNAVADGRLAVAHEHGASLIDLAFTRALMLAIALFLLAIAYRLLTMLLKRDNRSPNNPSGAAPPA